MLKKKFYWAMMCIAMLMLLASSALTQDFTEGELDLFGKPLDVSALIYQVATSGSFIPDTEDRFRLELSGVANETTIVQVSPPGRVDYNTNDLAQNWLAAAGLQSESEEMLLASSLGIELPVQPMIVEAELSLPDYTILLRIYSADYDSVRNVLIYYVEIEQIVPFEIGASLDLSQVSLDELETVISLGDKEAPPEEFSSAVLTISGTDLFWKALQDGADQRLRSIRVTEEPECVMARGRIADLEALSVQLRSTQESLYQQFQALISDPENNRDALITINESLAETRALLQENSTSLALLRAWSGQNC